MNPSSKEHMAEIRNLLSEHPRGLSIKEISQKLHRHRNSVSRDLQALLLSGQVLQQSFGIAKVYTVAQRTPVSRIIHYTSDMILITDQAGKIINANNSLSDFLSCSPDEMKGRNIGSDEHPLFSAIKTCPAGDWPLDTPVPTMFQISMENRISHLKSRKIATVSEDGAPGFVYIIEDVTDKIVSKDAIKRNESGYQALVEAFPGMASCFLADGTITFSNQAFSSYFYPSSGENPYKTFFSLVYPDDCVTLRSFLADLSPGDPASSLSLRVRPADGALAWTTWAINAMNDGDSGHVIYHAAGLDTTSYIDARVREAETSRELAFLTMKSRDFLDMEPETDIYNSIGGHLRELIPGASIAVYAIDPTGATFTIKSLIRDGAQFEKDRVLKGDYPDFTVSLCGEEMQADEIREVLSSGSLADIGGYLYHCLIRKSIHGGFERVKTGSDGKQVCSAGLVCNGSLIGAIEIVTGKDSTVVNRDFIETYINMASMALQRWESELELRGSEERFKQITTVNPLPISIIDQDGHYTYLSPRFTEIFGYTLEDIPTGKEWFMYAFPNLADQMNARETWKEDLLNSVPGVIRPREFRVRCKDGLFKEILFLPVSMSDGQQLVVYEDLTLRLEAEQTRNLLSDIFRSSHDGIFSTTVNGRILSWNPSAERIYGYTFREVTGRDVRILEPPSLKGEISSILERVNRGESITKYETKRLRKDGRLIDVSLTISPVYRDGTTIIGASTIIRDITSDKAEERLKNAEMRYQDLVNNINVGVYRSTGDPEGKFIWGNTSLLRILGYDSMDDLQGIAVIDIFARSGGRAELLAELRKNGFVKNREIILRRGDSTTAHVLVTALATFSPDGSISYINGIVEDITGQRLLEQKVARLTRTRKKS